ncbi:hypothetical protein ID866_6861 [Astraeus odoratus]|nr:hypothetical protein ID866_6861 [Astraeus odoratus]
MPSWLSSGQSQTASSASLLPLRTVSPELLIVLPGVYAVGACISFAGRNFCSG